MACFGLFLWTLLFGVPNIRPITPVYVYRYQFMYSVFRSDFEQMPLAHCPPDKLQSMPNLLLHLSSSRNNAGYTFDEAVNSGDGMIMIGEQTFFSQPWFLPPWHMKMHLCVTLCFVFGFFHNNRVISGRIPNLMKFDISYLWWLLRTTTQDSISKLM